MASKKHRYKCRVNAHPLNKLEGRRVTFTSGKWIDKEVLLERRSKKGIWDVATLIWWDWEYDKLTDEQLFACCDIKAIKRDIQLQKIGIYGT